MKLFFSNSDLQTYVGFNDRWAMLLGILPMAELSNILFIGAQPGMGFVESFACFGISLVMTICFWIVSRYWVIQLRMRYPRREQTPKRIVVTLLALALTTLLIATASIPIIDFFTGPNETPRPTLLYKTVMSYTLVLMVVAIYEGVYFFVKYKESLLEQERLAKENMQAQLSVLKQQMNPHFLFNSLNTLVNIIPEDTEKATLFTQRLSAVYRRILEYRHKEMIPLSEELVALKDYIFLMQTRFEDKLVIRWDLSDRTKVIYKAGTQVQTKANEQCEPPKQKAPLVPPHLRHHKIVPLSVQLLVENAIKHNVISSEHPLYLDIILDDAAVTVRNQLRLRDRKLNSTGWGHHNLEQRYQSLLGQSIVIRQTETEYSVSLPLIPARVAARAAVG